MEFTELSQEQIDQLRSGTRQAGLYRQTLDEFVASGLQGADVTAAFPGRKASSVVQALKKVAKRNHEGVVDVLHVNSNGTDTIALVRTA